MKKAFVLGGMLLLVASVAFATPGIDLSFNNCARASSPASPGAQPNADAAQNCLDFGTLVIIAVFQPSGAVPQISAVNGIMDMQVGAGFGTASYWNFWTTVPGDCNAGALSYLPSKPTTGCGPYLSTWQTLSATPGGGAGRAQRGAAIQRIAWNAFRDNGSQNVNNDQQCFGGQFAIDGSNGSNNGTGTCTGCEVAACLVFNEARVESFDGAVVSPPLTTPTGQGLNGTTNVVTFNGGSTLCAAVPVKKKTWGQLKSLYR